MPKVYKAAMEIDTRYVPDQRLADPATAMAKCDRLDEAAADAAIGFRQLNGNRPPEGNTLRILAAPKCLLGIPQGQGHGHVNAYSETDRTQIHAHLATISTKYPGLLMICGTVLYKRIIDRHPRRNLAQSLQDGASNFKMGSPTHQGIIQAQKRMRLKGWRIKHLVQKNIFQMQPGKLYGYNEAVVYHNANQVLCLKKADNVRSLPARIRNLR
ncbi:MAG: hypothetical protein ACI87W_001588 [Halieaceae bacterium]|jgi:hypothetical protein